MKRTCLILFLLVMMVLPAFAVTTYWNGDTFGYCEFLSASGTVIDLANTTKYPTLTSSSKWRSSGNQSYTDAMMLSTVGINRVNERVTVTINSSTGFQYVSKENPDTHRQYYLGVIGKKYQKNSNGNFAHADDSELTVSGNITHVSNNLYIVGNLDQTSEAYITMEACSSNVTNRWLDFVLIVIEDDRMSVVSAGDYESLVTFTSTTESGEVIQTNYTRLQGYYNHEATLDNTPGIILTVLPTATATAINFNSISDGSSETIGTVDIAAYFRNTAQSNAKFKVFLSSSSDPTAHNVNQFRLLRKGDTEASSNNSMNYTITLMNSGEVPFCNPTGTEVNTYTFDGTNASSQYVYLGNQQYRPVNRGSYYIVNYSLNATMSITLDSTACAAIKNKTLLTGTYSSYIYFVVLTDN